MGHIEQKFLPFYESIVDHPIRWIMAWILFIGLLVSSLHYHTEGFTQIKSQEGPYIFFRDSNPQFRDLQTMRETFQSDETLMFLFSPASGDVFSKESLKIVEEITNIAWTLPYVIRVESLASFQHTVVNGDELITDNLYRDPDLLTPEAIESVKSIALNEKAILGQTISLSGHATSINAFVAVEDGARIETPIIMDAARKAIADLQQTYPNADIKLLGDIPIAEAAYMTTETTLREITPIGMALVVIALWVLLRSVWCILITQLMITLSIGLGYTVFLMSDDALSSASALGSPMILTLAVADCVHILVTYLQQGAKGANKREAMLESLRINFQPVWLTSITTAIGFLFMNFAEAPPFNHLGNVVCYGILFAFALSVTLLPAIMMLLPQPKYQFGVSQQRYMKSLADFTIKFKRPLFFSTSIVVVALVSMVPLNQVNDIFNEYYDETYDVRKALDFYLEEIGGLQRLEYSVPADGSGGAMEPEYLSNIEALIAYVEAKPEVSSTRSFVEVVKRLNRNMHSGDQEYYRVPDNRELISQYVLLYELGLPQGMGLDAQIDFDKSMSKLEIVFHRIPSHELVKQRADINQWIKINWPDYMQTEATGLDSLFCDVSFDNVKSMFTGTVIALIMVSALLIFTLRSLRYGLLSLLPNLLPTAMAFGIWGLWVGEIGLVASVLGCMTLGIIVDDTVHFLSKYVRAKREQGLDAEQATQYAFQTVGVSLIATTVILVANFGVMGASHYLPNFVLGVMTSLIIVIALVLDFFFFVPLLLRIDKSR
ncbi:MAG: efflux RND transporter permease subunit [Pseudomonadales bacterium]|nr:efflux RND transporter permease subunit [Pseudomonadales bacterium]